MKYFFTGLFFFLFSALCFAQNTWKIEGILRDSLTQEPLAYAILSLYDSIGGAVPIAYTITNEQGVFNINAENRDKVYLTARLLSHRAVTLFLEKPDSNHTFISIDMTETELELNEVVVVSPMAAIKRGDTTIYQMDKYIQASDISLEDVLKRMPGLRVDKEGRIYFQGRAIESILIEGDNLTGQNYQQLSKTIAPNMIEQVEVISNFQENPLLAGISDSESTIINLKLKKGYAKFFGDLKLAGGNDHRYLGNLNLFGLLNDSKTLTIAHANSQGTDAVAGLRIAPNHVVITPLTLLNKSIIQAPNNFSSSINLPPEKLVERPIWNNQSKLLSMNLLQKINKLFSFRFNLYAMIDKRTANKFSESNYFNNNDFILRVTENEQFLQKPQRYYAELISAYTFDKKSRIEYYAQASLNQQTINNSLDGSLTYLVGQAKQRKLDFFKKIEYTNRINDKSAFVSKLEYCKASNNSVMQYRQSDAFVFPQLDTSFHAAEQKTSLCYDMLTLDAALHFSQKGIQGKIHTGLSHLTTILTSNLLLGDTVASSEFVPHTLLDSQLKNNLIFAQNDLFGGLDLNYSFSDINIHLEIYNHLYQNNLKQVGEAQRKVFWIPTGQLRLKYRPNKYFVLLGNINLNNKLPEADKLFTNYLQTSYRNIVLGGLMPSPLHNMTYRLTCKMDKLSSNGQTFLLNMVFSQQSKAWTTANKLQNNFFVVSNILINKPLNNLKLTTEFSQRIAHLQSIVFVQLCWGKGLYYNAFENTNLRSVHSVNKSIELRYVTFFKGVINIETGLEYTQDNTLIAHSGYKTGSQTARVFTELAIDIEKRFIFKPRIDGYSNRVDNSAQRNFIFLDFTAAMPLKNKRWLLELSGYNLLNNKTYRQVSASDFLTSSQRFTLFQRYVLLGLRYKF